MTIETPTLEETLFSLRQLNRVGQRLKTLSDDSIIDEELITASEAGIISRHSTVVGLYLDEVFAKPGFLQLSTLMVLYIATMGFTRPILTRFSPRNIKYIWNDVGLLAQDQVAVKPFPPDMLPIYLQTLQDIAYSPKSKMAKQVVYLKLMLV